MKRTIFYTIVFNIFVLNAFADGALDVKRDTFGPCDRVYFSLIEFTQTPVQENHYYTVSADGDSVMFSYGNLQYQDSTKTFRFARRQWMVVGNGTIGDLYFDSVGKHLICNNDSIVNRGYHRHGAWIDLFGWGTNGYGLRLKDRHCTRPRPTNYEITPTPFADNKYGYGPSGTTNITMGNYDWGKYCGIYGVYPYYLDTSAVHHEKAQYDIVHKSTIAYDSSFYAPGTWRLLSADEWTYMLDTRKIERNVEVPWCYATISYDSTDATKKRLGILIFPNDFTCEGVGFVKGTDIVYGNTASTLTLPYKKWYTLDSAGVTFLPCAGTRVYTRTTDVNTKFLYWTSTAKDATEAKVFSWNGTGTTHQITDKERYTGCAVRLVRDADDK